MNKEQHIYKILIMNEIDFGVILIPKCQLQRWKYNRRVYYTQLHTILITIKPLHFK